MKARPKPKTSLIRIQGKHTTLARSKPTRKQATARKNKRSVVKMGRGTHRTRHSEQITAMRRKLKALKAEIRELKIEKGIL